jgi:hemerythrin superfamily protein
MVDSPVVKIYLRYSSVGVNLRGSLRENTIERKTRDECIMAVPLDSIRAFHNAFRKEIKAIDEAAYSAVKGQVGLDLILKRYSFFNEVLVWHAQGEEELIFPALESVAPLVAEAYERDHRGLDTLFDSLQKAVRVSDILAIARATSAFNFFLTFHLNKEEAHLYRIFNERITLPNQGVGSSISTSPKSLEMKFVRKLWASVICEMFSITPNV